MTVLFREAISAIFVPFLQGTGLLVHTMTVTVTVTMAVTMAMTMTTEVGGPKDQGGQGKKEEGAHSQRPFGQTLG